MSNVDRAWGAFFVGVFAAGGSAAAFYIIGVASPAVLGVVAPIGICAFIALHNIANR